MNKNVADRVGDAVILLARILLVVLFVTSGWGKLTDYGAMVGYMTKTGLPLPSLAAMIAIVVELCIPVALVLGVLTRPLAVVMALYTLVTALIGHHYWTMEGAARLANMTNFYKNVSITGGFLLLYVTGAGRYAIEARSKLHAVPDVVV